jgi:hypothetical protein
MKILCADRVENTVFKCTPVFVCISIAAGTCLPSRCLETALLYFVYLAVSAEHRLYTLHVYVSVSWRLMKDWHWEFGVFYEDRKLKFLQIVYFCNLKTVKNF